MFEVNEFSEEGWAGASLGAAGGALSGATTGALSGSALGAAPKLDLPLSKSLWNRLQVLCAVLPECVDLSEWPEVVAFGDESKPESKAPNHRLDQPEDVLAMARAVEAVRRSCSTGTWQQVDVGALPRSEIVRHVIEYSVLAALRHVFGMKMP